MSYIRPERPRRAPAAAMRLARGLGWLSLAIGAAELLAPRSVAKAVGLPGSSGLVTGYGVRELASGAAILLRDDPAPFVWARVGGDGLDLLTLAAAFLGRDGRRAGPAFALLAVASVTALDMLCATGLAARAQPPGPVRDYSDRSGFPHGHPRQARGG